MSTRVMLNLTKIENKQKKIGAFICNIPDKFAKQGNKFKIQTVKGEGYWNAEVYSIYSSSFPTYTMKDIK